MNKDLLAKMEEEYNFDVKGTLNRFMNNETLYLKFLRKFLEDNNYQLLVENYMSNNFEEMFKAVHTLKGVSGNLGLTDLYNKSSEMTNLLRNQNGNNTNLDENVKKDLDRLYLEICEIYDVTCKAINEIHGV